MIALALIAVLFALTPTVVGDPAPPPAAPEEPPRTPYLDRRAEPLEYPGPGREDPAPEKLTEFRVGWFGPSDPADPDTGDFWAGALLVVEEINKEGGVSGLPLRLVPGWSESPWAGGVNRVARMVYEDRVLAIIGSIDGAATHLAEQVVAKALVPLVSPGSTDKTVSFAGVPWVFTLLPGDDVQAAALAGWLSRNPGVRPVALVSATDHDSRAAATEFRTAFSRAGVPFTAEFQCAPDDADAWSVADQVLSAGGVPPPVPAGGISDRPPAATAPPDASLSGRRPGAVVILASPRASGRIASALRAAGYLGAILGGSNLARHAFLEAAASVPAASPPIHEPSAGLAPVASPLLPGPATGPPAPASARPQGPAAASAILPPREPTPRANPAPLPGPAGAAEGTIFPLVNDPGSKRWEQFTRAFASRHSRQPDFTAGAAYDALRLTVEAARRAGPNPARILDNLRALSPWPGVTGEIRFDNLGRNLRPVRLATIRQGKVVPLDSR